MFHSIQFLRAIAATTVVLFHLKVMRVGEAGVDVFFIISGFIMASVGLRDTPAAFFVKRLIRLVPLYWIVTLVMCAGAVLTNLFTKFTFDTQTLLKSMFFIPYYDGEGKMWPLVVPGWTLNYEVFFYVLFAIGLMTQRPIHVTLALLAGSVGLGFLLSPESAPLKVWTHPLLAEFAAGLLLARCGVVKGKGLGCALIAVSLLAYIPLFSIEREWVSDRLFFAGIPALLFVGGAVALERAGAWPKLAWAEKVGDASYSLYLLHGLVISVCKKFLAVMPGLPVGLWVVGTYLVAVVVAIASYELLEKPISAALRRFVPRGAR